MFIDKYFFLSVHCFFLSLVLWSASCAYAEDWIDLVVPGGTITGYKHGQFPSLGQRTHAGIDIGGGCGMAVYVPSDGRVIKVVDENSPDFNTLGNALLISHYNTGEGEIVQTLYLHLSNPPEVPIGPIDAGTKIGNIGDTGAADGCHLHFEVRRFEGIHAVFHPVWRNIYGPGDWSNDQLLTDDWYDPVIWLQSLSGTNLSAFTLACSGANTGDIPCPFETEGECGEGCRNSGILFSFKRLDALSAPGSQRVEFQLRPRVTYAYDRALTFSIPCRGFVSQGGGHKLQLGNEVFRVGAAMESTYAFIQDGSKVYSAYGDEVDYPDECNDMNETWFHIISEDNHEGWVKSDSSLTGTDRFSGATFRNIPEWTWDYFEYWEYPITVDGNICNVVSRPLIESELIEQFSKSKHNVEYLGGFSSVAYYRLNEDGLVESNEFVSSTGQHIRNTFAIDGNQLCEVGGQYEICIQVRQCVDNSDAQFVAEFTKLSEELVGLNAGYKVGDQYGYIHNTVRTYDAEDVKNLSVGSNPAQDDYIIEGMDEVDYDTLSDCAENELKSCLISSGYSQDVADAYERLFYEVGIEAHVASFTELGAVDLAEFSFLYLANSNYQNFPVNSSTPFTIDTVFDSGLDSLIRAVNWPYARYIVRNFPNYQVLGASGQLVYFRRPTPESSEFYIIYPIADGCRACDIIGSITMKYDYFGDTFNHDGTGSMVSVFSSAAGLLDTRITEDSAIGVYSRNPILLQSSLQTMGYDVGVIDGVFGPRSQNALRDFQFTHCLEPSGMMGAVTARAIFNSGKLNGECYVEN